MQRVGLGFIHELAALDLEFTGITTPDGESLPLLARIQEVDNARERLTRGGQHSRDASDQQFVVPDRRLHPNGYRMGVACRLAVWAIKALLLQVPEPELYYPAGVEMTLALTGPMMALPPPNAWRVRDV